MSLYDYEIIKSKSNDPYDIEFISFSGAGTNGLCYAGVLKSLREHKISVKYWIGTSAGAIVAALAALGADEDFLIPCLSNINIANFLDIGGGRPNNSIFKKLINYHFSATELFSRLGIARGIEILKWIKTCIVNLGFSENITFSELYEKTGNHLVIVTVDVNSFDAVYLSRSTYPNLSIADAINVSMIIPYLFQPTVLKDSLTSYPRVLVDGGILNNCPINVCDPQTPSGRILGFNRKAIGFFTISNGLWGPNQTNVKNFMDYSARLLETMFRHQERLQSHQPFFWERCIPIETDGHSPIDFSINQEWIDRLVNSGYETCQKFLKERAQMIKESGNLPENLFIPLIFHKPIPEYDNWIKTPNMSNWIPVLTNNNLRDTLIYQTNPEVRMIRNIVGL